MMSTGREEEGIKSREDSSLFKTEWCKDKTLSTDFVKVFCSDSGLVYLGDAS